MIEDSIFSNPLPLLAIKNTRIIQKIDAHLPYSSAFEVECRQQATFDVKCFENIPDIMDVDCDSGEQRFRVPSGLKGLVCLYRISEQLRLNSELNPLSGIHYHVDCTDIWHLKTHKHEEVGRKWILEELETWNPEYTIIKSPYWLKFNCLKTMEYRVGEMTFDYEILAKRMIHCNDMTRRFKILVLEGSEKLELANLKQKLEDIKKRKEEPEDFVFTDLANEVIKTRIKRI